MLTFNFDFQNYQKFLPLFAETFHSLKNFWLHPCFREEFVVNVLKTANMKTKSAMFITAFNVSLLKSRPH